MPVGLAVGGGATMEMMPLHDTGESPAQVVEELGLKQISDESALVATVEEVIVEHQDAVENYRSGNENSLKFLVGQVMRKSKGRANPQLVNRLLEERLRS